MAHAPQMPESPSLFDALKRWWAKAQGSGRGPDVQVRRRTNKRLHAVLIVVLFVSAALGWRLVDLQVIRADALADAAVAFRSTTYVQEAERGDILDSNGTVLATSVPRYNVRADQIALQNYVEYAEDGETILAVGPAAAARKLAPVLDVDEATLGGQLRGVSQNNQWALIASGLTSEEWQKVAALEIHGIYSERYMKREYPGGTLAGNLLGYVGQSEDDSTVRGRAGVEQHMDSVLSGTNGSTSVQVGPNGTEFPDSQKIDVEAVAGRDVRLTIDSDLQKVAEDVINKVTTSVDGDWGSVVVLEIGTGRVLAMAETNSPNPGDTNSVLGENHGIRSISNVYEPGSVGKLLTVAAALDQGTVTPTTLYQVSPTRQMPNGETIKDAGYHPTENMTVAGIIDYSYNTGTIQIGDTLSDQVRFDYIEKFGLGAKTGIDLPAEEPGILRSYTEWGNRDHYTTMFGQGIAVTNLQLAQMVAVFGQDGVLIPPRIVDGYEDESGVYTPTVMGQSRQVVSKETAQQVNQIMQGLTQLPWDPKLSGAVPGYNVAGKTGTAENVGAAGTLTAGAATFVGLVPAENPRIAMAVTVYSNDEIIHGSLVSAPAFGEIGAFAMQEMKVPPSTVPLYKYPWYERELS